MRGKEGQVGRSVRGQTLSVCGTKWRNAAGGGGTLRTTFLKKKRPPGQARGALHFPTSSGRCRTRTCDPYDVNVVLYQLS